jgi:outer membrane protein OmpA-like peptidoglycan-associated protein
MPRLLLWIGFLLLLPPLLQARPLAVAHGAHPAHPTQPAQGTYGFAGTILNAASKRPVVADVVIYGTGQTQLGKLQTSRTGTFTMSAETTGPYRFVVTAIGYAPQEVSYSTQAGPPTAFTVQLVPLEVGMKVTLNNIRFEQGKYVLLPESFEELDRVAELLTANEHMEIQLNGHTDNQGDPAKNVLLSENRVKAVQEYLVRKGVPAARLRGKGFGGSQPIASNKQEYTRKLNRRVEFEILKNTP